MNQGQLIEAGKHVVVAKSVIPVHNGQHKMLTDEGFQHVRNTGDHSTYVSPKGGIKIRTRGNGFMTAVPNKPGAIKAGGPGSGRHAGGGFGSVAQSHGYTSTGRDANGNHTYTKTDSAGKTHDLSVNHGTGRWSHDVTTPASNTELRNSSTVGRFSGKTSELTPENGAALLKEHLSKWD